MNIIFSKGAWEQYLSWQQDDPRMVKKINALIKDCQRHPEEGLGQPEPLKHQLSGWWSRRIDQEHRLVYRVVEREDGNVLEVAQCRGHY